MAPCKPPKELDEHILQLIFIVLLHSIFSISSFIFIITYALGFHFPTIDLIVGCTVGSFLVFNQCVAIDIYEYYRKGREELPTVATDDFARNILKTVLRHKDVKKNKKLPSLRLDILKNVKPFVEVKEEEVALKFLSRKMHYTVVNIIITVLLLVKYKKHFAIPLLIPWLSMNFTP